MDLRFLSGNFVSLSWTFGSGSVASDYVFKQVFGKQENEKILISFLNAMLNGDYNITSAKVINSDLPRFSELGRAILLDVQVLTDDGTHIDVEVQQCYRPDLIDRMFVYGANMVSRYNKKSTSYNRTKCIAIWILDCNIPSFKIFGKEQVIGEFCFHGTGKPEVYLPVDELKIYPIELKKGTDINNITTLKETWINFLKSSTDVSKPEEIEEIHKAYKEMLTTAGSDAYRNYVDALEKGEELIRNELYLAKKKSKAEGRKEGLAEGVKKGRAEGEHRKAVETAKNLLDMGLTFEQISKATGLSVSIIKEL